MELPFKNRTAFIATRNCYTVLWRRRRRIITVCWEINQLYQRAWQQTKENNGKSGEMSKWNSRNRKSNRGQKIMKIQSELPPISKARWEIWASDLMGSEICLLSTISILARPLSPLAFPAPRIKLCTCWSAVCCISALEPFYKRLCFFGGCCCWWSFHTELQYHALDFLDHSVDVKFLAFWLSWGGRVRWPRYLPTLALKPSYWVFGYWSRVVVSFQWEINLSSPLHPYERDAIFWPEGFN